MNTSGDAAEQIVRMSLEGVEVAARITGSAAKELALFLVAALKNKDKGLKLKGKARLTSMLKSGKSLEIFSLKESDLKKFVQGAKQYGIVYCVLRNTKSGPDGLCDVMVKADDAPKISRVIERFQFATVDKAKIESEIIAEKAAKTVNNEQTKPVGEISTMGAEPEAPDVNNTEKLLDELMGAKEGKAEPDKPELKKTEPAKAKPAKEIKEAADNPPFFRSDPPTSLPSETTSDSRKNSGKTSSSKPSVREEMREIAASRQKEEPFKGKAEPTKEKLNNTPQTTTHKQPPRNSRSKSKKSKGNR
ncbi:MAG: PcfB family protein [Clostridiales bacterium]|jgi:hypothetical protein|nr:PcfB family protein [Clostridiales bacterium]